MLFTFAEYFLQINFVSLDALSRNSEQIKLSEFLKRNNNLTFLRNTWCSTGNIPNIIWDWSVTSRDLYSAKKISLTRESQQKTLSFDHEPEMDRLQWHIKALGDIWKILAALWHSLMQLSQLCQKSDTQTNICVKRFIKFGSGGLKSTFERPSTDKINTQISADIDPS